MEDIDWNRRVNWTNLQIGLAKYVEVMAYYRNEPFEPNWEAESYKNWRTRFNHFYRLRRNEDFQRHFYKILFQERNESLEFSTVLYNVYNLTGRIEASFASKLLATINPDMPVWDSEVLNKLGVTAPRYGLEHQYRLARIVECYKQIIQWYLDVITSDLGIQMGDIFDERIGIINITQTKKIDLMLWQLYR